MKRPRSPTLPARGPNCTCPVVGADNNACNGASVTVDGNVQGTMDGTVGGEDRVMAERNHGQQRLCPACQAASCSIGLAPIGSDLFAARMLDIPSLKSGNSNRTGSIVWPRMFPSWSVACAASRRMNLHSSGIYFERSLGSNSAGLSNKKSNNNNSNNNENGYEMNDNVLGLLRQLERAHRHGPRILSVCVKSRLERWAERISMLRGSMETIEMSEGSLSTISVAFSKCGKLVASTHGDHTVKLFSGDTQRPLGELVGHPRTPWTVKFDPRDANRLASGCLSGQLRVWNARARQTTHLAQVDVAVVSLAFHPSKPWIALAAGKAIYLWDYARSNEPAEFLVRPKQVRCVVFSPCGARLLTGEAAPSSHPSSVHTSNNREENTVQVVAWKFHVANIESWFNERRERLKARDGQQERALVGVGAALFSRLSLSDLRSSPRIVVPHAVLYNDGGLDISPCGRLLCTIAYQGPGDSNSGGNAAASMDVASALASSSLHHAEPTPKTSFASTTDEDEGDGTEAEGSASDATAGVATNTGSSLNPDAGTDAPRSTARLTSFSRRVLSTEFHNGSVSTSGASGQSYQQSSAQAHQSPALRPIFARLRAMMLDLNNTNDVNSNQGQGSNSRSESPPKLQKVDVPGRKDSVGSVGSLQINSDEQSAGAHERPPLVLPSQQLQVHQPQIDVTRQRSGMARRRENLQARHRHMLFNSDNGVNLSSFRQRADNGTAARQGEETSASAVSMPAPGVCKLVVFRLDWNRIGEVEQETELQGALARGITSVKFSPTGTHIVIGYGKHDRSRSAAAVAAGAAGSSAGSTTNSFEERIAAVFSTFREQGLVREKVLDSVEDDINATCFHPTVGHGFFLGTRRGKLRFYGFSGMVAHNVM